jgi:polysaccharide biosynthesis transport protein
MDLKQYLTLLWRWLWLILLLTVAAAGVGFITALLTEPVYAATATVLVNQAPSGDLMDESALVSGQRLAQTYIRLMTKRPVLEEAIGTAGITMSPEDVAASTQVAIVGSTGLITIRVENPDPVVAARLANLIPTVFAQQNGTLQASRYAGTLANLSQELASVNEQIQQTQTEIDALGAARSTREQAELAQLQGTLGQLRQSHTTLLQTYEATRLAEAQSTSNIQIVELALVPDLPIRPNIRQTTVVYAALGLLLALGLVFLIEYLDDSIRSPEQARELLQAPVLGFIARVANTPGSSGPLTIAKPRSPEAEAFRSVRTNIQYAGIDRPIKMILVTSAGPGEGKSTVVSNLAVVMAQTGLRVVLVDADLRRATLHRIFGRPNRNGLTDILLQSAGGWNSAVQETAVRNLMLVTAGPTPPNPADLLGSQRMQQFLAHLAKMSDVVIIDTPPTLVATDALVLAPHADSALVVIDTGATRTRTIQQVKSQFEQVGVKIRGVIMNKVVLNRGSAYHYYQYYYYQYSPETKKGWRWPWEKRPSHKTPPAEIPPAWNAATEEAAPKTKS